MNKNHQELMGKKETSFITVMLITATVISLLGIQSCKKTAQPVIERRVETKPADASVKKEIKTGWEDPDTYTVMVVDESEEKAVNKAKIQILKDIINVRFKLYGKYSKIAEIKDEFNKPLKNGEVISRRDVEGGVEIYFTVRYKNLKKMVEKKQ